ncbi:hypothetical protein NDU88_000831 [Pleurodeles waltl]|uniref:t-SNARE coiled-coil homology domain-containing protein n=1 Tax=Pleurodeles waltl TaxID=8319 RepID=A0AAV7NBR7_PLEWA|nr:hypothetical protein NDU88_000831 [Pleurodeles waltl]
MDRTSQTALVSRYTLEPLGTSLVRPTCRGTADGPQRAATRSAPGPATIQQGRRGCLRQRVAPHGPVLVRWGSLPPGPSPWHRPSCHKTVTGPRWAMIRVALVPCCHPVWRVRLPRAEEQPAGRQTPSQKRWALPGRRLHLGTSDQAHYGGALFSSLHDDIETVKKDLSADLREVRQDLEEIGHRVSAMGGLRSAM